MSNCIDDSDVSICQTEISDVDPWLLLDSHDVPFNKIVVKNRVTCCQQLIDNFIIEVYLRGELKYIYSFSQQGSGQMVYAFNALNGLIVEIDTLVDSHPNPQACLSSQSTGNCNLRRREEEKNNNRRRDTLPPF